MSRPAVNKQHLDLSFGRELSSSTGENISRCFQCHKCVAGCPMASHMDIVPSRLLRMVQLGMWDQVRASTTIWLCSGCETCALRCPNGISIAAVMDELKARAVSERISGPGRKYAGFHRLFLTGLRWQGRLYELGLMGAVKLVTRDLFSDLGLGVAMFMRRKLKLFPQLPRGRRDMSRLFAAASRRKKGDCT